MVCCISFSIFDQVKTTTMKIKFSQKAKLPTKYGEFNIISFKQEDDIHEHCLLFLGEKKYTNNKIML